MAMPSRRVPVIDTMIGFPVTDFAKRPPTASSAARPRTPTSKEGMRFPAEYMFKDVPEKATTQA